MDTVEHAHESALGVVRDTVASVAGPLATCYCFLGLGLLDRLPPSSDQEILDDLKHGQGSRQCQEHPGIGSGLG